MFLHIGKDKHDGNRVPILIFWDNVKVRNVFFKEITGITKLGKPTKFTGFTAILIEHTVYKPADDVHIKFVNRAERNHCVKHANELENDGSMYITTPPDIPQDVVLAWVDRHRKELGLPDDMECAVKE